MKKIISLVLVLIMVLSLAACGAKPTAKFVISDATGDEPVVLYEFEAELAEDVTAGAMIEEYLTENGVDYTIYDGDMIGSIGELEQDAETWSIYWACYYNGEYAQVGLWGYEPEKGDLIEVKFEESNW